jgi:electron transfer flavoprotein alpha subunit
VSAPVWVWAEHRDGGLTDATWELLAEGRELAGRLGAPLAMVGLGLPEPLPLDGLGGAGVERLHLVGASEHRGAEAQAGAAGLAALAAAGPSADPSGVRPPPGAPAVLLVPATAEGADLAARAAIRLGADHVDDCLSLRAGAGGLHALRWACDDRLHEEWLVPPGRPLVATFRPGTRGRPPLAAGPAPVVERHPAPVVRPRVRHLGGLPGDPGTVPLAEAPRIVAAGLGIGARRSLGMVEQLAGLLGASLGATRPLADRGWVAAERQIGTTGQTVSPRLYVALGISGALQHLSGIIGAETMVAVNTDRTCPMMSRATLAAVGDVGTVVPLLVARLRERASAAAARAGA